ARRGRAWRFLSEFRRRRRLESRWLPEPARLFCEAAWSAPARAWHLASRACLAAARKEWWRNSGCALSSVPEGSPWFQNSRPGALPANPPRIPRHPSLSGSACGWLHKTTGRAWYLIEREFWTRATTSGLADIC